MSPPKKLQAKKKLLERFWDWPPPPSPLNFDRRTTDKSPLEKLHCLLAGGAKKFLKYLYYSFNKIPHIII